LLSVAGEIITPAFLTDKRENNKEIKKHFNEKQNCYPKGKCERSVHNRSSLNIKRQTIVTKWI
jgi:hypothetical protein